MKSIVTHIMQLPKWYGIGIVFIYSILFAEFSSTLTHLIPIDESWISIFKTLTKIHYGVTILSGFIVWLIMSLLFHLTALLFNGYASFGRMTRITSYPFMIPAIIIPIGIILLDDLKVPQTEDIVVFLSNHPKFKLTMALINYSFVPYYLIVAVFIRHIYQIKYLYAILSIAIPVVSIWAISELFKLI
jgi:hypothetical protein